MLSGLRAHKASEERESYYLSDERLDFTQRQIDIANRNISIFLSIVLASYMYALKIISTETLQPAL